MAFCVGRSHLIQAGVPIKVVSERLGHASVAFTMQVYQHVLPGMQADAATRFGEAVFGGGSGQAKQDTTSSQPRSGSGLI